MEQGKKYVELLNAFYDNHVLALTIAGIISADTLDSVDKCDKAIETLTRLYNAIPHSDIDDKESWERKFVAAIEVAKDTKEELGG